MHLWRIIDGKPSWLDAVWVSGILTFGYKVFIFGSKVLDYLEPKGTIFLVLGYGIMLVLLFGFMGIYLGVFFGNQKKLAPAFLYPRRAWLILTVVTTILLQTFIYYCAQGLVPDESRDLVDHTRVDLLFDGSLVLAIVFNTLCYSLLVAFTERFPNLAVRASVYGIIAMSLLGIGAKLFDFKTVNEWKGRKKEGMGDDPPLPGGGRLISHPPLSAGRFGERWSLARFELKKLLIWSNENPDLAGVNPVGSSPRWMSVRPRDSAAHPGRRPAGGGSDLPAPGHANGLSRKSRRFCPRRHHPLPAG